MEDLRGEMTQPKTTDEFVRALYYRQSIVIDEQKAIKDDIKEQIGEIHNLHEATLPAICTRITKLETTSETMKWVIGTVAGVFGVAISILEWLNRPR